jgi:cellulose binding protein with CBM2 domain
VVVSYRQVVYSAWSIEGATGEAGMVRARWIVTMGLTASFLLAGGLVALSAYAAGGLATTLTTMTNGTGYHATYAITNQTSTTIRTWRVAFILSADAHITDSAGAQLTSRGQLVTASSTGQATEIASGATVSFTFDVTGGAAPPFECTVNGVQCPPTQPNPSGPSPTPTSSAPTTPAKPSPSATRTPAPSTAAATPTTSGPATTPGPPTPAPPTTAPAPSPTTAPSSRAPQPR